MKICKYRLPCGRCDKTNNFCDLTLEDIEWLENEVLNETCNHTWSIIESKEKDNARYHLYACRKCKEKIAQKITRYEDGSIEWIVLDN